MKCKTILKLNIFGKLVCQTLSQVSIPIYRMNLN